jgi:hypothetical protein
VNDGIENEGIESPHIRIAQSFNRLVPEEEKQSNDLILP